MTVNVLVAKALGTFQATVGGKDIHVSQLEITSTPFTTANAETGASNFNASWYNVAVNVAYAEAGSTVIVGLDGGEQGGKIYYHGTSMTITSDGTANANASVKKSTVKLSNISAAANVVIAKLSGTQESRIANTTLYTDGDITISANYNRDDSGNTTGSSAQLAAVSFWSGVTN